MTMIYLVAFAFGTCQIYSFRSVYHGNTIVAPFILGARAVVMAKLLGLSWQ